MENIIINSYALEEFLPILDHASNKYIASVTRDFEKIQIEKDFIDDIETREDQCLIDKLNIDEVQTPNKNNCNENPIPKGTAKIVDGVKVYPRNINTSILALANANYSCEIDAEHETFTRRRTRKPYTEPHHLIPMSETDNFNISLDREQNIISLCSNCHNKIHYGEIEAVREMLTQLFQKRKNQLRGIIGREIKLEELFRIYRITD